MLEINPYLRLSANEVSSSEALLDIDPSLMIEELEEKEARPDKIWLEMDVQNYHCVPSSDFVKEEEGLLSKLGMSDYLFMLNDELNF